MAAEQIKGVSHSRVEAFLTCRRKEFYGYYRKLEKVQKSTALAFGSAGHLMLQTLYSHVLAAGNTLAAQREAYPQAVGAMWKAVDDLYRNGFDDPENRAPLRTILEKYLQREPFIDNEWDDAAAGQWKILAVEKEFNLLWDEENGQSYPFVIDVLVMDPYGRIVVVDHKFVYDLYRDSDTELMPQIPKYIGALRALGYKKIADYGIYNMLCTRKDTKAGRQLYEWTFPLEVPANTTRVLRTFEEQVQNARAVAALDKLDPEERDRQATRIGNKEICKFCDFRELCSEELRGGNVALLMQGTYQLKQSRSKIEVSEEVE